jgi:uncharacterized protein YndB with AHSA1/START domain
VTLEFVRTELGTDPIFVEGYFAASPATVFRAWTDPNIVMKWFGRAPNFPTRRLSTYVKEAPGNSWNQRTT